MMNREEGNRRMKNIEERKKKNKRINNIEK